MIGLGDLPGGDSFSDAFGISADGSVIVGWSNSGLGGNEAFRWTEADGMVGLGELGFAWDVSADGSIIVGASDTGTGREATIWDSTNGLRRLEDVLVLEGLDLTGWTLEQAFGISDDGLTIAGSGKNPAGQSVAWVVTIIAAGPRRYARRERPGRPMRVPRALSPTGLFARGGDLPAMESPYARAFPKVKQFRVGPAKAGPGPVGIAAKRRRSSAR
jgi:probable HAF family extracellular repeat protein